MRKLVRWFQNHRKAAAFFCFLTFTLLACSSFPFYNLTKPYPSTLTASILFVNFGVYSYLGGFLAHFRPKARIGTILPMVFAVILGGMLCRWLLEYGEVSNTYNFTPVNIFFHLLVTAAISMGSWYWTCRNLK